jgi:integrase
MNDLVPISTKRAIARAISREAPKYFTHEEAKRIISPSIKAKSYRAWFLCLFLYSTGMRVSEALSVRVRDFDPENRIITVKTLKRKKEKTRAIPVSKEFAGEFTFWAKQNKLRPSDHVFGYGRANAHNLVQRACGWAGITDDRAHPHTWRHTYAVICLSQGVPITVVRRWMGHQDLMSTLIYTEILAQDSKHFIDQVEF